MHAISFLHEGTTPTNMTHFFPGEFIQEKSTCSTLIRKKNENEYW